MRLKVGVVAGWWQGCRRRRYERLCEWHRKFVWLPMRVVPHYGNTVWVWLEHVERQYRLSWSDGPWYVRVPRSEFEHRLCESAQERNERILRGESR